jgi:hypothetical protein
MIGSPFKFKPKNEKERIEDFKKSTARIEGTQGILNNQFINNPNWRKNN